MLIQFKKIPQAALYCYAGGFCLLAVAMMLFYCFPALLSTLRLQQLFILGAVIVAVGSVINTLSQFKFNSNKK